MDDFIPQRDFKLKPGATWCDPVEFMVPVKNQEIDQAVQNFKRNIERIHALATSWTNTISIALMYDREFRLNRQFYKVLVDPLLKEKDFIEKALLFRSELHQQDRIYMREHQIPHPRHKELIDAAFHWFDLTARNEPVIQEGLDGWLASQITSTWTAFEILSSDLWVSVANSFPQVLKGSRTKEFKQISYERLFQYDFNLKNRMGTIMAENLNFSRLDTIKEAFEEIFREGSNKVDELMSKDILLAVSQIRHLIIHSNMIFDAEYCRKTRNSSVAPKGDIGKRLLLDYEVIHNTLEPFLTSLVEIILEIDEFISVLKTKTDM